VRYGAMGVQSSAVARRDVVRVLWFAAERYSDRVGDGVEVLL